MMRKLIAFFFVYLLAEGALRKWILPEASTELYVVKDLILAVGFFSMFGLGLQTTLGYFKHSELAIWLAWVSFLLGYFVLRQPSLAGLAGLRYYLAPLPLILLVPLAIGRGNGDGLMRASNAFLVLTMPICLLGILQFVSPVDANINRYAWTTGQDDISGFAGLVEDRALGVDFDRPRITGTFSYISTYAAFLTAALTIAWTALAASKNIRGTIVPAVAVVLIFMNLAMTGSRAPVAVSLLLSVPYVMLLFKRATSEKSYGVIVIIVLGLAAAAISAYGAIAFDAILMRAETGDDTEERIQSAALLPILTFENIEPLGLGIGATFGGLEELGIGTDVFGLFKETVEDRAGAELGYLGYTIILCIKCIYVWKTWLLFRSCIRRPDLRVWALSALAVQLSTLWQIPFHNPIASSFYFASLGLFHWIRRELETRSGPLPTPYASRELALRQG